MSELRALAGFSTWRAADFSQTLLAALLEAARTAAPAAGAGPSERSVAASCAARAADGDSRTPVSLAVFHAAIRATMPGASALAPGAKRALSEALTTLFLMIEEYESLAREGESTSGGGMDANSNSAVDGFGGDNEYAGSWTAAGGSAAAHANSYEKTFGEPAAVPTVPASELVTALLVLCDGSKTDKLVAAFHLADSDGDGSIGLTQLASLLRGVLVGLAGVRSRAHIDAEPPEETEALDALNETALHAASNILRLANTRALGLITFAEFGEYYNGGGFATIAFLELLDWKKLNSPPSGTLLAVAGGQN
jgi:Ca2+-binding EF-hand superfamily protein